MESVNLSVYILRLERGKYYVGKSDNVNKRIKDHFEGVGSMWTQRYPPIEVETIIENCDEFDEDKYTKIYMAKYGIDNVRGGSYVTIVIDLSDRQRLEREIATANDLCFKCMKHGHFAKECHESDHTKFLGDTTRIRGPRPLLLFYIDEVEVPEYEEVNQCYRCGRKGHIRSHCYAKTHLNGKLLDPVDSIYHRSRRFNRVIRGSNGCSII